MFKLITPECMGSADWFKAMRQYGKWLKKAGKFIKSPKKGFIFDSAGNNPTFDLEKTKLQVIGVGTEVYYSHNVLALTIVHAVDLRHTDGTVYTYAVRKEYPSQD